MQIQTKKLIKEFVDSVNLGFESWSRAGEIMVKLVIQDSEIFGKICNEHSNITEDMCEIFWRIGRKEIFPRVLLCDTPGTRKLIELPYEKQVEYLDKPIAVASVRNNGEVVVEQKRIQELTKEEAGRALGTLRVRTKDEQVEMIKRKEARKVFKFLPWEVRGDEVFVRSNTVLKRSDLMDMLSKLPPEATLTSTIRGIEDSLKLNQISRTR